jgi:hypothetical protein
VLDQEVVGFEPVAETLWDLWFGPVWLGRFNERTGQLDLLHKKDGRVKP